MAAENVASVQMLCFLPVVYFLETNVFSWIRMIVTLKAAESLQFQWKSRNVGSFAGFKLMKVFRLVQQLNCLNGA